MKRAFFSLQVGEVLTFPLCRTCAREGVKSVLRVKPPRDCTHNASERQFVSTSTHIELRLALAKGYAVTRCIEAQEWTEWSEDVFKSFIKTNLRIKIQASGWPAGVDKLAYLHEINSRYGLDINERDVCKNEGLRTIAKLR